MWRNIGWGFVSFILLAFIAFAAFPLTFAILGPEGSYAGAENWEASMLYSIIVMLMGTGGAFLAGLLAWKFAGKPGVQILLGIVLVYSLVIVGANLMVPQNDVGPRPSEVTNEMAAQNSRSPLWATLLNPIMLLGGVVAAWKLKEDDTIPPTEEPVI